MTITPLAAVLVCAALAACAGSARGAAPGEPELAGVIVSVEREGGTARVTVAVRPTDERAVLRISPDTEIAVRRANGAEAPGDAGDLAPGARIEAWHDGTELRSLPPQYLATRIRVLAGP
jgi:hypothetical protein